MNMVPETTVCEAPYSRNASMFSGALIVYTEDVGGSSPSSPTINSNTYGVFAKNAVGSMNLSGIPSEGRRHGFH